MQIWKPYLSEMRMSARLPRTFGAAELIGSYGLKTLRVAFLLLLWRSLFQNGAPSDLTLDQTLRYTLCSAALAPLLDVRTPAGSWLHDGAIATRCLRPMGILGQLAVDTLGAAAVPLAVFLPLCGGLGLCMGLSLAPASGWFWVSLLLCITQGFAIDMLFACLIIRVGNLSFQVHMLRGMLGELFAGGVIPFAALPWGLGKWFALSPLGTLAGAPLGLYAGFSAPMETLVPQAIWNAVLWPLCLWGLKRSSERLVSFGG